MVYLSDVSQNILALSELSSVDVGPISKSLSHILFYDVSFGHMNFNVNVGLLLDAVDKISFFLKFCLFFFIDVVLHLLHANGIVWSNSLN